MPRCWMSLQKGWRPETKENAMFRGLVTGLAAIEDIEAIGDFIAAVDAARADHQA